MDAYHLPPRPDLSRAMMSVGFMARPTQFLQACQDRCGDYFTLRPAPDREVVFTADPAAIKQIFTTDPDHLRAGEANIVLSPLLGPGSTLLLDGPEHLRHRRLLLPPFHGEKMRAHVDTMREIAEREVATWPRDQSFGVINSMQAITLEVIMRLVFGVEDHARRAKLAKELRTVLDTIGTRRKVVVLMGSAARGWVGARSPWGRFEQARERAVALLREEIRTHPGDGPDVLSMLLAARDEQGNPLTEDELTDELMTLLVAGHETTAAGLAWTLERLTRTPEWLHRLGTDPAPDDLDAVVTESLRLRPVVPAVVRKLMVDMRLGQWHIPAGMHVAPSIYLLHRRPDIYPDPDAFRPERFLDAKKPGTYEWIPFGGGIRRCLGAAFALTEMKVVLDTVLREAKLQPAKSTAPESTTRRAITFAPSRGGRVVVA